MLLDGKWDHNSNVSLSSLLQFFMINFMDMCILNIIMGSLKNNSLHHSLSSDKSQKELWILIRKMRGRPCSRGEKYSVIILNKSTAARLHIKNGWHLLLQRTRRHNSFDNVGFVSHVRISMLRMAQAALVKAHPWPPCYIPSHWFSPLERDNELITVSRTPCVWPWVGQDELTPRLVLGTFTFSSKALPWPC
jgi:hypothetical protein